jgi:hypothetical protein
MMISMESRAHSVQLILIFSIRICSVFSRDIFCPDNDATTQILHHRRQLILILASTAVRHSPMLRNGMGRRINAAQ